MFPVITSQSISYLQCPVASNCQEENNAPHILSSLLQTPPQPTMRPEESHEFYHPGGSHPVHLGEVYHGRYEILRKLGHGRYSTIWLARDQQ